MIKVEYERAFELSKLVLRNLTRPVAEAVVEQNVKNGFQFIATLVSRADGIEETGGRNELPSSLKPLRI